MTSIATIFCMGVFYQIRVIECYFATITLCDFILAGKGHDTLYGANTFKYESIDDGVDWIKAFISGL